MNNVEIILISKKLEELDNVWMIQLTQNRYL